VDLGAERGGWEGPKGSVEVGRLGPQWQSLTLILVSGVVVGFMGLVVAFLIQPQHSLLVTSYAT